MVSACEAALESPQIPPEARERIQSFLKLYGAASAVMEERRADVFVRRLIERVGLRRQRLFAAQPEVAERLLGLSRLAELAAAWARREPHGSTRDFVRHLSAVAEAGVEPVGGAEPPAPGAVRGLDRRAAKGMEFDHVFVLGLERGAGAERDRAPRPARARPLAGRARRRRRGAPLDLLRRGAGGGRRRGGGARGGAVRPGRGPARDLPDAARGGAGGVLAGRAGAVRAAARHRRRRQPRDRPLPGAAEAGRARPAPRRRGDGARRSRRSTGCCARSRPRSSRPSSTPPRSTPTCSAPSASARAAAG